LRLLAHPWIATVSEDSYPVRWTGWQAIVTLPDRIEVSNACPIREQLLLVINRGATELIADMTATVSCDHAGADAVVRAYQRAVASGTQLRLVVTAPAVRRVVTLNGLDRLIPVYPTLAAATAAAPAAVSVTPGPGSPDAEQPGTSDRATARGGRP
jgi:anti-sigma B factor antagonist